MSLFKGITPSQGQLHNLQSTVQDEKLSPLFKKQEKNKCKMKYKTCYFLLWFLSQPAMGFLIFYLMACSLRHEDPGDKCRPSQVPRDPGLQSGAQVAHQLLGFPSGQLQD